MVGPTHHLLAGSNYLTADAAALVVPHWPLRRLVQIVFIIILPDQAVAHEIILNYQRLLPLNLSSLLLVSIV